MKVLGAALLLFASFPAFSQDINKPSEEQVQATVRKFSTTSSDKSIVELVNSARSRASEVITMQACYKGREIYRYIGRYVAPDKMPELIFVSPMSALAYHDKSTCLTVDRIDAFKAVAKNALSFRVVMISESSGESKSLNYTMVRQSDGEWLFSRAGRG